MEFSQNREDRSSNNDGLIGANLSEGDAKSSRLQKAIARNRAKQSKRESSRPSPVINEKDTASDTFADMGVRKSVGLSDNIEFTKDISVSRNLSPKTTVSYSTAKRKVRTKSKKRKENVAVKYLIKASWIFCVFLVFRLIFSDGGVVDYYSTLDLLESKKQEFVSISKDNDVLISTIKKIKTNARYQRKLVRDNLGFIAQNEFLILFPKKKEGY